MAQLPAFKRFWDAQPWENLPSKNSPIIAASLAHWDTWIGNLRNRVEEVASALATLDSNTSTTLASKADKSTKIIPLYGLRLSGLSIGSGRLDEDISIAPLYGATANTIAQGNDSRIVNALQKPTSGGGTRADLLVGLYSGLLDRLPIGGNGLSLIADATAPLGMRWGTPSTDPSGTWTAWQTLPLGPGVVAGDTAPAWRLRGEEVQLRGIAKVSGNWFANVLITLATIPAQGCPRAGMAMIPSFLEPSGNVRIFGASTALYITPGGSIQATSTSSNVDWSVNLNGISYVTTA